MTDYTTASNFVAFEQLIVAELKRLDAHCTNDNPCGAVVHWDDELPYGWCRVSDDHATWCIGSAQDVLDALKTMEDDEDFSKLDEVQGEPNDFLAWPHQLTCIELLEDLPINGNPYTVISLTRNDGVAWCAGPHGVDCCCVNQAYKFNAFYDSRAQAIASLTR